MELDTAINDAGEENISYVGLQINRDPMTVREIWKKTRSESTAREAEDENNLKIMTIKALMEMNARAAILPKDFEALSMKVVMDKLSEDEMSDIVGMNIEDMVQKVLPYYLYICSENADIICTQSEKQRKINPEIIPRYRVGQNVGRILHKHKKIYLNLNKEHTSIGIAKRPHYRGGHFRRQLYGCRPTTDEMDTRFHKTIFIPPSYINMKDESSHDPNHLRARKITCNKDA